MSGLGILNLILHSPWPLLIHCTFYQTVILNNEENISILLIIFNTFIYFPVKQVFLRSNSYTTASNLFYKYWLLAVSDSDEIL